jgi:septal ring factor EnvC (AmiA/AmiB activator)
MKPRAVILVVAALLSVLPVVPGVPAGAVPAAAQQDSLERAERRRLEQVRREAAEKRAQASKLKVRENAAVGQLRRTERELRRTRDRLRRLQQRRSTLDAQLEVTAANLERSIASLGAQRQRLRERLRSSYKTGPARDLEVLLSTTSFAQLLARWDFLTMVAQQDRILLESVRAEKEEVEHQKARLEQNLGEVEANAQRTTGEQRKLDQLRTRRATDVRSIQTQRQAFEAAAAELERTARRIQALLARLERQRREEAQRARDQGRDPQPYSGDFARGQGQLDWPVRGEVVARFGIATHPRFGTQIQNDGIDIAAPVGTAVRAVAKGRVDFASDDYEGVGGMIVLNHGDGYYTLYSHLSEVSVRNAQEVQPGQVIGRVGEEGSLRGPALHFEVRKGSTALDPGDWLR